MTLVIPRVLKEEKRSHSLTPGHTKYQAWQLMTTAASELVKWICNSEVY